MIGAIRGRERDKAYPDHQPRQQEVAGNSPEQHGIDRIPGRADQVLLRQVSLGYSQRIATALEDRFQFRFIHTVPEGPSFSSISERMSSESSAMMSRCYAL